MAQSNCRERWKLIGEGAIHRLSTVTLSGIRRNVKEKRTVPAGRVSGLRPAAAGRGRDVRGPHSRRRRSKREERERTECGNDRSSGYHGESAQSSCRQDGQGRASGQPVNSFLICVCFLTATVPACEPSQNEVLRGSNAPGGFFVVGGGRTGRGRQAIGDA